jgi:hypothetical protein
VIVAVPTVRMMQVVRDEVVHVIAVRDGLVAATLGVLVSGGVAAAGVARHAPIRVGGSDREAMIVHVTGVEVVKVPVVQVVRVSLVTNGGVPAARPVYVAPVIRML